MEEPIDFFYHHICHFCKLKSSNIRTCSGCRLISYCSQIHQKEDWKYHKSLCLCVRNLLKELNVKSLFATPSENSSAWRRNCLSLMCTVELKLKRPLRTCEKQMFFFPNVCRVCFIANFDRNYTCERCHCISYCCPEHQRLHLKKHESECLSFKTSYKIDKICFDSQFSLVNFDVPQCNGLICLGSMEAFLNEYYNTYSDSLKTILSEHYSAALSMLFAVNSSNYIRSKNEVNIHIVGAGNYEQSLLITIEILFHRFLHLKKINLVLIGPESCENYLEPVLCEQCMNTRKLTVYKEKKLYHQYNKCSRYTAPDIVFSFNCGFSEVLDSDEDTWQESIKDICNLNVLFAFTSYTESEAITDLSAVLDRKPEVNAGVELPIVPCQNPFKSLRPYRNWECFENTFFFNNYYIRIIEIKDKQFFILK